MKRLNNSKINLRKNAEHKPSRFLLEFNIDDSAEKYPVEEKTVFSNFFKKKAELNIEKQKNFFSNSRSLEKPPSFKERWFFYWQEIRS